MAPVYEYTCPQCKTVKEVERSIHAEADAPMCMDCSQLMARIWSNPAVKFNAGGFYSTGG